MQKRPADSVRFTLFISPYPLLLDPPLRVGRAVPDNGGHSLPYRRLNLTEPPRRSELLFDRQ
jgi:hypothetical protein